MFNPAAAADLGRVFASTRHVAAATTGASLALLVISVVGVPASFQRIAELVWELPEAPLTRAFVRQLIWIGTLITFIAVLSAVDTLVLGAGGTVVADLVVNNLLAVPYLPHHPTPRARFPDQLATAAARIGPSPRPVCSSSWRSPSGERRRP